MTKIRISPDLTLPVDIATQTLLVVGKRGSGKSNTCVRMAEQLFAAGVPFVTIDPVDNWWGVKASGDGKGAGLAVYVFGGKHADAPLEPGGGALMADVLIESRVSAVLSVKHFTLRERARFVADFAHRLFERNTEPLHVFLEEAHEVAPQDKLHGDELMVNRVCNLAKLGRSCGIGVSAITQRPASLSKNLTTQAEILVAHRLIGPQDIAAIREWIKYHGDSEEILGELSGLGVGEAFLWAPGFPESKPLGLTRVQFLRRETFDSAATPKVGEKAREPRKLAPVDLAAIGEKMSATIERAKADDPKALRARIVGLERELAAAKKATPAAKVERVEVPITSDKEAAALDKAAQALTTLFDAHQRDLRRVVDAVAEKLQEHSARLALAMPARRSAEARINGHDVAPLLTRRAADGREGVVAPASAARNGHAPYPRPVRLVSATPPRSADAGDDGSLPKGAREMLRALAMFEPDGMTRAQVATFTGISVTGGTFAKYLSIMRTRELVVVDGEQLRATGAGLSAAGDLSDAPRSTEELVALWRGKLAAGARAMLDVLVAAHPRTVSRAELGAATSIEPSGGTFAKYLSTLHSAGLVEKVGGELRAGAALFLVAR